MYNNENIYYYSLCCGFSGFVEFVFLCVGFGSSEMDGLSDFVCVFSASLSPPTIRIKGKLRVFQVGFVFGSGP